MLEEVHQIELAHLRVLLMVGLLELRENQIFMLTVILVDPQRGYTILAAVELLADTVILFIKKLTGIKVMVAQMLYLILNLIMLLLIVAQVQAP